MITPQLRRLHEQHCPENPNHQEEHHNDDEGLHDWLARARDVRALIEGARVAYVPRSLK